MIVTGTTTGAVIVVREAPAEICSGNRVIGMTMVCPLGGAFCAYANIGSADSASPIEKCILAA